MSELDFDVKRKWDEDEKEAWVKGGIWDGMGKSIRIRTVGITFSLSSCPQSLLQDFYGNRDQSLGMPPSASTSRRYRRY
jgi:hypothetical protein